MKRSMVLLSAVALLSSGCATFYSIAAKYSLALTKIEHAIWDATDYSLIARTSIQQSPNNETYKDEFIEIIWHPTDREFGFLLTNMNDRTIFVLWDRCAFVDSDSTTHAVTHSNVRYLTRYEGQGETIIPSRRLLSDVIVPSDHIANTSDGWKTISFLSAAESEFSTAIPIGIEARKKQIKEQVVNTAEQETNGNVGVLLAISMGEQLHEYFFTFEVDYELEEKESKRL